MVIKNGIIDAPVDNRDYLAKVVLFSDAHVGYDTWGDYSIMKNVFNEFNKTGADFCISLGDNVDSGYSSKAELMAEQLAIYNDCLKILKKPVFKMKGNHDVDVEGFTEFGTITFNGIKFICIFPKYIGMQVPEGVNKTVESRGMLTQKDIDWIENELKNCEGYVPIILSHYCIHLPSQEQGSSFGWNICDVVSADTTPPTLNGGTFDGHRDELIELCRTYNVPLFLNGHDHAARLQNGKVDDLDMVNVQIGALGGNYTVLTVYSDRFEFEQFSTSDYTKITDLTLNY